MAFHNILLIDDDEEDQEIFTGALEVLAKGLSHTVLSDASIALEQLDSGHLTPDVIFLDLNMPRMSGQEFLVAIKKRELLKDIPVIIFSTTSHTGTIRLMRELGAQNFITKPINFDELVGILASIL